MRSIVLKTWVVQGAAAAALVLQSAIVPALIGADAYGKAISFVAMPLLIQGLLEPMVNGVEVAVKGRTEFASQLRHCWKHMAIAMPILLGACVVSAALRGASLLEISLVTLFLVLALVNTALRASAFADLRFGIIVAHYCAALLATAIALPLLPSMAAAGYLAMLCCAQVAVLVVLLRDRPIRERAVAIWRARTARTDFAHRSTYAANLAARLAQITLGPGILLLASLQLGDAELAEFRLCQTFLGAVGYVVPGNAVLVQALSRMAVLQPSKQQGREPIALLLATLLLAAVATAILWLAYPHAVHLILGLKGDEAKLRWVTLSAAPYVLAPLLAAYLLGHGKERFVLCFSIFTLPFVAFVWLVAGAPGALVLGAFVFCLGFGLAARNVGLSYASPTKT